MSEEIQGEVLYAIECEIGETPKQLPFRVKGRRQEERIWRLEVDPLGGKASRLDESLEGATAWWPEPVSGCADVLSVIPDREEINLRFATGPPPPPGEKIFLYPPDFLKPLYDRWANSVWAEKAMRFWASVRRGGPSPNGSSLDGSAFGWLRRMQRKAFDAVRYPQAFLWGPPGTGKTRTLGALVASYLLQYPHRKVAILSTTNAAVDQSIVAVDRGLEELNTKFRKASDVRRQCFRLGYHYIARNYEGREHLLPSLNPTLVKLLAALESAKPDPDDVTAYAAWKTEVERVRAQMRAELKALIASARLAALTCARALFTFEELSEITSTFDLVVFDESTQVSLAHALALAPLGKQALFAGDPKQLGPIHISDNRYVRKWLGNSMLDDIRSDAPNTIMLDEQSRMAKPICDVVSKTFYGGKLRVAEDCLEDPGWLQDRELVAAREVPPEAVFIKRVEEKGFWYQKYGGPVRPSSAAWVEDIVPELRLQAEDEDIMILTPFRAQRAFIRQKLRPQRCRVRVSTVHRAQGQEFHTILFDPVDGGSGFLQGKEAERLINVALSRAKARLVVIVSEEDLSNPILQKIVCMAENGGAEEDALPVRAFCNRSDFPQCLNGERIRMGDIVGVVQHVESDGSAFSLYDIRSGKRRRFKTDIIKAKHCQGVRKETTPVSLFMKLPDFPLCMKGCRVRIGNAAGIVEETLDGGRRFTLVCSTGRLTFRTTDVLRKYR